MLSGAETMLMVASEDSELTAVDVTPNSVSGGSAANALSVSIYRRDSTGSNQKLLAYTDKDSARSTAWVAFRPKALSVVSGITVAEGGVITAQLTASSSVPYFPACITLHLRKVS